MPGRSSILMERNILFRENHGPKRRLIINIRSNVPVRGRRFIARTLAGKNREEHRFFRAMYMYVCTESANLRISNQRRTCLDFRDT